MAFRFTRTRCGRRGVTANALKTVAAIPGFLLASPQAMLERFNDLIGPRDCPKRHLNGRGQRSRRGLNREVRVAGGQGVGSVRTLSIVLEDGFVDDRVVVTVDGKVVLDEEHVRTRTQTGMARLVEVQA